VEGIEKDSFHKVYISPFDDNLIYTTSTNTLFRSYDRGKIWQKVFVVKDEGIRDLYVDEYLYDVLYLASQSYLYRIVNGRVEKIFTLPPETESMCVKSYRGVVYLGTNQGLYHSRDDFWRWRKWRGLPENSIVYSLAISSQNIYIATNQGVYKSSIDRKNFKKVFVLKGVDSEEETETGLLPRILEVDRFNPAIIYLGTSRGLFVSYDEGNSFLKVRIPVVENADIRCISQIEADKQSLYLATNRGIFAVNLRQKRYKPLFEGLPTKGIWWLDFTQSGMLIAATEKGLFLKQEFSASQTHSKLDKLMRSQPPFREVQEAALRYNEVHPEKIREWRKALKLRGLFPTISLDYDKTIHYDSGSDRYYIGPRDWGLRFSWDVGDLIWNSYHDDVDTRSRLNTQLRINILDDINGLYFERLRVKMELMGESLSEEERITKELRLEELTAALDGYTGGYFSKRLRELERGQPKYTTPGAD
jgi:hypothetical protein